MDHKQSLGEGYHQDTKRRQQMKNELMNEIGKLRHETSVGFLEVQNQLSAVSDRVGNMAKVFDKGLGKIESLIDKDLKDIKDRVTRIEKHVGL